MFWLSLILMMPFTLSVLDSHICDKFFLKVGEDEFRTKMILEVSD